MHSNGLLDDETIGDEFADGLTGVGIADFAHFVGIEPDLALACADHGGREALLSTEVHPVEALGSVYEYLGPVVVLR